VRGADPDGEPRTGDQAVSIHAHRIELGDPERLTTGISTWAEQAAIRERAGGMRIETYRRIDIERALGVIAGLGTG
jgi:hypothetical protein